MTVTKCNKHVIVNTWYHIVEWQRAINVSEKQKQLQDFVIKIVILWLLARATKRLNKRTSDHHRVFSYFLFAFSAFRLSFGLFFFFWKIIWHTLTHTEVGCWPKPTRKTQKSPEKCKATTVTTRKSFTCMRICSLSRYSRV